jgi:chorismate lyase/3-hydroxybenzoate synthase
VNLSVPTSIPKTAPVPRLERGASELFSLRSGEQSLVVPARQLGPASLTESWNVSGDVIFGSIASDDDRPLDSQARDMYARIIADVRAAGFPYFVRMWNHIGAINAFDDGEERYKLFCAGRHDAFVDAGYHHDVDLPAASAVGMQGRGLVTWFLAAREQGRQVENPRQIAAYNYPPQYGRKTPSFSRATVWGDVVYVSGTSSVVGHETVHAGDVMAQLEETLRNIEIVLAQTGRTLANVLTAKTYVRHPSDYEAIAARLANVFPANLYLEAEICRADLLLEIECVAR